MMYEEKNNEFIDCMLKKTRENRLFWQPIYDFLDTTDNDEIIDWITKFDDLIFINDDSYYAEKHESLLFIIHYKTKDSKDLYYLYGSVSAYSSPFCVSANSENIDPRCEEIWKLAKEQREYVLNEDGFPEPVYYFYRNMMAND